MNEKKQVKRIPTDVVIIGAGPGGLTAALYTSRANLSTVVLEQGAPGGALLNTGDVENYPGYSKITGPELAGNFYESAMAFGAEYQFGVVEHIVVKGDVKEVHTGDCIYEARAVVIATGATNRKLGVPGELELSGRGVSYCAVCDGFFFKNKDLFVVGGGDSAVEEGVYLTQFAKSVRIIHRRDQLRAQQILQDRAFANEAVSFIWNSEVVEIQGKDSVTGVRIRNNQTGQEEDLIGDGVFIYVGLLPNTKPFRDLGITDEEGWIVTNETLETRIPGVFAVGDVRQTPLRQIATAVGDGSLAGQKVYDYLQY